MGVDGKIEEWVPKLNKALKGLEKASENLFYLLKSSLEKSDHPKSQVVPCVFYRKYSAI